jgi:ADP-ribose pyrophosphatase YjhB (NUDIX family)
MTSSQSSPKPSRSGWRRRVEPYLRPLFQGHARLTRGMTLGVRGVVLDEQGRVLLVEHTYLHGWWLPGGGVDRGETAEAALVRELREEAGVEPVARPVLISLHSNEPWFRGDHVALFRVDGCRRLDLRPDPQEISAVDFFAPEDLPEGATPATRRRLAEALGRAAPDVMW